MRIGSYVSFFVNKTLRFLLGHHKFIKYFFPENGNGNNFNINILELNSLLKGS